MFNFREGNPAQILKTWINQPTCMLDTHIPIRDDRRGCILCFYYLSPNRPLHGTPGTSRAVRCSGGVIPSQLLRQASKKKIRHHAALGVMHKMPQLMVNWCFGARCLGDVCYVCSYAPGVGGWSFLESSIIQKIAPFPVEKNGAKSLKLGCFCFLFSRIERSKRKTKGTKTTGSFRLAKSGSFFVGWGAGLGGPPTSYNWLYNSYN